MTFQRQEGRVLEPANDFLINTPGLFGSHDLPANFFFTHPERKIGEDGFSRHWVEVGPLSNTSSVIAELLLNFHSGDTPIDLNSDL